MAIKTEHSGPKRGRGNYFGKRQIAKSVSRKLRRRAAKKAVKET